MAAPPAPPDNPLLGLATLGCVGSEYRQPLGLVFDFLAGDEPPHVGPNHMPDRPWHYDDVCIVELMKGARAHREWVDAIEQWGRGPQ